MFVFSLFIIYKIFDGPDHVNDLFFFLTTLVPFHGKLTYTWCKELKKAKNLLSKIEKSSHSSVIGKHNLILDLCLEKNSKLTNHWLMFVRKNNLDSEVLYKLPLLMLLKLFTHYGKIAESNLDVLIIIINDLCIGDFKIFVEMTKRTLYQYCLEVLLQVTTVELWSTIFMSKQKNLRFNFCQRFKKNIFIEFY
ncbi:hypothetical protein KUTeg_017649 [Tegillarca granosa]|uniref:Uncharacterized protein n=1 Tax=Tegillarca granosa TaxID=220873 RepID=A0ABQ9EI18_TEGGR|nr:hypothetical protein KUTeg_017649 [Tegillarca granosa]